MTKGLSRSRVSRSRESRSLDFLFVRGDGSAPSKEFVLDRRLRVLTVRSMNWEPGMKDDTITMRRVPGGWMRSPRIGMKTAEQVVTPNRSLVPSLKSTFPVRGSEDS